MSGAKTAADRQPMHRALDHSVQVTSELSAPVHSLVLAGGASSRMGSDKALLSYFGMPHVRHVAALLEEVAPPVYVSVRESQVAEEALRGLRLLCDPVQNIGPMAGLLAAFAFDPGCAWLVVAVDLPGVTHATLARLMAARDSRLCATAYRIQGQDRPDPVCAIYEPGILPALERAKREQRHSLMFLRGLPVQLVEPADPGELQDANTPREYRAVLSALQPA